jgi:putative spermidine/putrescine transport system ATP-binding protein
VSMRVSETGGAPPAVRFDSVSRHFGRVRAVDAVDLDVADGEFFAMLGPSGSGKTTCLRLIGGFERPSSGRISLHGRDVSGVPPYDRDVNTVFQDYALFPHLDVARNVGYGLRVRKVPKGERAERVEAALHLVRLGGLGGRRPSQLSGGQRQRVALARALVNRPRVLLLDEPLGALDLKLRQEMQVELKRIQREVGITFVFVTHDQEEALTMSDRLAVFHDGRIEQVGAPADVYEHPATEFVAGFVGTSNLVPAAVAEALTGDATPFAVRPEKIALVAAAPGPGDPLAKARAGGVRDPERCQADGVVRDVVYLGPQTRYLVELDAGCDLVVVAQNHSTTGDTATPRGHRVRATWPRDANRALHGSPGPSEPGAAVGHGATPDAVLRTEGEAP